MTGKIHIAGEVRDKVQRCVRCHTDLNQGRYAKSTYWPAGQIYMTRYGAGTTPNRNIDYRPCGRKGKGK